MCHFIRENWRAVAINWCVRLPLIIRRIRQSRKIMRRAIASSLCGPVMPWMKTRSRLNDVNTITASNSCSSIRHRPQCHKHIEYTFTVVHSTVCLLKRLFARNKAYIKVDNSTIANSSVYLSVCLSVCLTVILIRATYSIKNVEKKFA